MAEQTGASPRKTSSSKKPFARDQEVDDYAQFLKKEKERFRAEFEKPVPHVKDFEVFEFIRTLGKGAFGRVMVASKKQTAEVYAVKIISKRHVVKRKQLKHAWNELKILSSLRFPFAVRMQHFHKDNSYLYYFMPFVSGGEMFVHLRRMRKFSEHQARFYAAQVVLALEYLHYLGLVHRDLKPENILLDGGGYLKLADFGFAKVVTGRAWTLCGTPEYMAPETITCAGYLFSVDWWALGVLVYEMNAGYSPFRNRGHHMKLYEEIVSCKYTMPITFSVELKDIVRRFLQVDITKRYGCMKKGAEEVKNHKWFKLINWLNVINRKMKPPYVPKAESIADYSHFEKYKEEEMEVSDTDEFRDEFENF